MRDLLGRMLAILFLVILLWGVVTEDSAMYGVMFGWCVTAGLWLMIPLKEAK